ncbi:hypothetical protein QCA50_004944 [Cerrena zonata]|uniref:Uncharacterized protein n=1 Tax=Cerrena zonata TaxID=2478898 RepID=A0AAW0GE21_9APHY
MQTTRECLVEVNIQYRGARVKLLQQQQARQSAGSNSQPNNWNVARFSTEDLRSLGCFPINMKMDLFQNGVRAFWTLQDPSSELDSFELWATKSSDVALRNCMFIREMAVLSIRMKGASVRTLMCKADKTFQRADPRTLGISPSTSLVSHSNQPLKRPYETIAANTRGHQIIGSTVAAPGDPNPGKRMRVFPRIPTVPVDSSSQAKANTANSKPISVPIQSTIIVPATSNPTVSTQVVATPILPSGARGSAMVPKTIPKPLQPRPVVSISQEQWVAALRKEREIRLKAEAELAAERRERIRLQELLDAERISHRDSDTTKSKSVSSQTQDETVIDSTREMGNPLVIPAVMEAFLRISNLTDALELEN